MKTIIIPTDFSAPSENAAFYALQLALRLNANIHLCHALRPEGPDPSLGGISMAVKNFPELREVCISRLQKLTGELQNKATEILLNFPGVYRPEISTSCDFGDVSTIVQNAAEGKVVPMVVMGMTGAGKLDRLVFGSNTQEMIKRTKLPLLIIPFDKTFEVPRRIAYSSEMSAEDKLTAQGLAKFAGYFNAELLVAHIPNFVEVIDPREYSNREKNFTKDFDGRFTFKSIEADNIDSGLELLKKEKIDMLVMGHENHGFLDRFIFGSYAARHASKVGLPLLIIPKRFVPQF